MVRVKWDRSYQLGLVVEDIDAAVAHFAKLGIGPFVEGPSESATGRRVNGEPTDAVVRGAIAKLGEHFELELLQPVSGNSIQAQALAERGEHALHLCSYTDNLARDRAELEAAGFPVISEGELPDGGGFAYFETRAIGGLILELHQVGPAKD